MPISLDGEGLKEWQNILINKNHLNVLGINIEAIPATILFDKISKKTIPIGFGVLSHSELEERIYATTKLEVGDDF
jgi:conjugal transfer pilus assembly protein TraF